jgi:hypothetical protein
VHRRHTEGLFERGSNVVDYWLAHCEGFDLGRSASGRHVTAVVCDRHTGHAHTLLVRSRTRRTRMVPAHAISAVDPFNKVLYLEPRATFIRKTVPHISARHAAAGILVARHWLVALRAFVKPYAHNAVVGATTLSSAGFRAGARYCADGAAWLRPRLRAAARQAAVLARRSVRAFVTSVRRRAPLVKERARLLAAGAVAIEARGRARLRHARVARARVAVPASTDGEDAGDVDAPAADAR